MKSDAINKTARTDKRKHRRSDYTVYCSVVYMCTCVHKTSMWTMQQSVLSWITGGQWKWSNSFTLWQGLNKKKEFLQCVGTSVRACVCECLWSEHKVSTVVQPFLSEPLWTSEEKTLRHTQIQTLTIRPLATKLSSAEDVTQKPQRNRFQCPNKSLIFI